MPQVYKRLWEDAAHKEKKLEKLFAFFKNERMKNWLKLLQSKNMLDAGAEQRIA